MRVQHGERRVEGPASHACGISAVHTAAIERKRAERKRAAKSSQTFFFFFFCISFLLAVVQPLLFNAQLVILCRITQL